MKSAHSPLLHEPWKAFSTLRPFLSEAHWNTLKKEATAHSYRSEELIFSIGQMPNALLCVATGQVKIFREGIGRRNQLLRLVRTGQYFGYHSALLGKPHATSAAGFGMSCICSVPLHWWLRALQENAGLCQFFLQKEAELIVTADERTMSLTQKHVRGRLAESILLLRDTFGTQEDGKTLDIRISRRDLAHLSNMITSNAIRTLSAFCQEGLLNVNGRHITLCDEEGLRRVSRTGGA